MLRLFCSSRLLVKSVRDFKPKFASTIKHFRVTSFRAFSEDKKVNIESLENDFNFLIKDLKELDALWMTEMKVLEKRLSIDISRYKSSSIIAKYEAFQAETKEKISLVLLRQLYLHFRITAREIVETSLTEPVPRVEEIYKGDNFVGNIMNLKRELDYSYFLKQLLKDVQSGHLTSFLHRKGIDDVEEFYDVCEFAFTGDRQAFFQARPFNIYYIEEEIRCDITFKDPFDKDGTLKEIENISSEVMQWNSRKVVDYLSKLYEIKT